MLQHGRNVQGGSVYRQMSDTRLVCLRGHWAFLRWCRVPHRGVLSHQQTGLCQSVLNAAARLIYRLKTSDHITDALISLHWLPVPGRIQCKLAVLAYKVLHGDAPCYLGPLTNTPFHQCQPPRGTTRQTVNSRQLSLCGYGSTHQQYSSNWRRCGKLTVRRLLKRFLFKQSYTNVIYWHHPTSGPCSGCTT